MSKVKLCGLCRPEDIAAANRCMPDYAGFVFAESRRQITPQTAAELRRQLRPDIMAVGVFVNQSMDFIAGLVQARIIDLVQLHGDEDEIAVKRLKARLDCPVIQAVAVGDSLPRLPENADYLLFDSLSPQRGGTGKTFDWTLLEKYTGIPYFLAGGLTLENAPQAAALQPFCVDVSSGVETQGIKDGRKMEAFVNCIRGIQ